MLKQVAENTIGFVENLKNLQMKMSKNFLYFNVLLKAALSLTKMKEEELFKKYTETESWLKFVTLKL